MIKIFLALLLVISLAVADLPQGDKVIGIEPETKYDGTWFSGYL